MYVTKFSNTLSVELKKRDNEMSYEEFCTIFKRDFAKAAQLKIQLNDDSDLLRTPAQKIISMLREI